MGGRISAAMARQVSGDTIRYRGWTKTNCVIARKSLCYCGKQGCIETFISGTGFATDYRRLSGHALKGSEIIRLVEESDPVAELALRRYELRLAKSLAHVVNILDPDVIVLGAG